MAASGKGKDSDGLKEKERAELRQQALKWLRDDLVREASISESGIGSLADSDSLYWLNDANFDSVRDPKQLAKLPEQERQAWQKFWEGVKQTQRKIRSRFIDVDISGTLNEINPKAVYPMIMEGGDTYIVELKGTGFDPLLRLEDANGKLLAENDDISPGKLNSRIVFRPKRNGAYRIISTAATTAAEENAAPDMDYALRIRKVTRAGVQTSQGKGAALHYFEGVLTKDDPKDTFARTKNSHCKVYTVKLQAGKMYRIDLKGTFDTYLRVENSEKKLIGINDDAVPGKTLNSSLVMSSKITANYRFIVTSFEPGRTGSFTLSIHELVKQGKPIVTNGTLKKTDAKLFGFFFKEHKIPVVAGKTYRIELKSKQFDTFLILSDPSGKKRLGQNDDGTKGDKTLSRIDFTPLKTTSFVVRVTTAKADEMGDYTLTVQRYGLATSAAAEKKK